MERHHDGARGMDVIAGKPTTWVHHAPESECRRSKPHLSNHHGLLGGLGSGGDSQSSGRQGSDRGGLRNGAQGEEVGGGVGALRQRRCRPNPGRLGTLSSAERSCSVTRLGSAAALPPSS